MVLQILQTLSYFGKFCFVILWETSGSRHFQNKRIIIYCVYNYRGYTMLKIYMYDIRCLSWQWQSNTLLRLELNFRGKLIISAPDSILIDLWTNLIALPRLSPCSCVILGNAVRKQYTRISRAIQHRETKRERERENKEKRTFNMEHAYSRKQGDNIRPVPLYFGHFINHFFPRSFPLNSFT